MISLVNGNGERVNNINFFDWEEAESWLVEAEKKGATGWYLNGGTLSADNNNLFHYIIVGFKEPDNTIWSMAIKTAYYPTPNEIMGWLKDDMDSMGYADIFEYYETDSYDVYSGYDTDHIDNWPIFGAPNNN